MYKLVWALLLPLWVVLLLIQLVTGFLCVMLGAVAAVCSLLIKVGIAGLWNEGKTQESVKEQKQATGKEF